MADDGKYDITIRLLLLKQYLEANAGYRHPKNSPSKKFRKQQKKLRNHTFQGFLVACVPFLVPLDFLLPEFRVGTGYVPVGLVSVPEAAMDEDDDAVLAHHDVGRSGHTFHVLTVAVAP